MMERTVVKDYEELSRVAADLVVARMKEKADLKLGLATGSTPLGLYGNLVKAYQAGEVSFMEVKTFNLDEYCGLSSDDTQSYQHFMDEHLFGLVDVDRANINWPSCEQADGRYDEAIREAGGVDLQVLGIGSNGHVGFNEPGSALDSKTRIVELADSTRQDNARFFADLDEVPRRAATMGLATIMAAKEILLLASGEGKKEAVRGLLRGAITEGLPASVLQRHSKVSVIVDEKASA